MRLSRRLARGYAVLVGVWLTACGAPPPAVDAWHLAPIGLEPIELRTHVPAACGADVTFISHERAYRPAEDGVDGALVPIDGTESLRGLARAITEDVPRRSSAPGILASAYNGPGGEPLFRWRLGAFYAPTFVFDRRVEVPRVVAVMRAAERAMAATVFLGGVDEHGERVCVRIATSDDLFQGAESADPVVATAFATGRLMVEAFPGLERPPTSIDWPSDPIWPGDVSPRQPIHIRRAPDAGASGWLRGAALARSTERWPVLVLE